jgi:hypothetical protein
MLCRSIAIGLKMLSLFFFAVGFTLAETKERKIEDRLISWWVSVDDAERNALSKSTAFMQAVSRTITHGFDLLLGQELFSARSVLVSLGASLCFTAASFFLFGALADFFNRFHGVHSGSIAQGVWIALPFVGLGVSPAMLRKRWELLAWAAMVIVSWRVVFYLGYVMLRMRGLSLASRYFGVISTLIVFSYVSDVLFIVVTRLTLKKAQTSHLIGIIAMLVCNLVLCILLIFAPVFAGVKIMEASKSLYAVGGLIAISSPAVNSVDIIASALAFAVAAFVLIHRFIFWPLIERPLYGFARIGITARRALFWSIGIFLWNNSFVLKLFCRNTP